jgi:general secretion pathway protein C
MDLLSTAQRLADLRSFAFDAPEWLVELINQWLPYLVILLLVILVGHQAAHLTWRLIPETPAKQIIHTQSAGVVVTPSSRQSSGEMAKSIANLHLFGNPAAGKPEATQRLNEKAPETNLKLTLYGVFAGPEPEAGAAIIGKAGSTQNHYRVGSEIMQGVKLQAVFQDRVVLTRKGNSEILKFPKIVRGSGQPDSKQNRLLNQQQDANSLSAFRNELKSEPLKIFQHVRFVPVRRGKTLKGYRVLPQKDRKLYNQLGLRPSDLVTAVNGIELNDDKEAMKLIDQLKDANQLDLQILRRGQPQSLNINLN